MSTAGEQMIAILQSIDTKLGQLLTVSMQQQAQAVPDIAPDSDLDSEYGDEVIKAKDPRDWTGEPMVGRKMSECPAEYLDMVAERSDYFARKNDEKGAMTDKGVLKSKYDRRTAARARGWAKRVREGKVTPRPVEQPAAQQVSAFDDAPPMTESDISW